MCVLGVWRDDIAQFALGEWRDDGWRRTRDLNHFYFWSQVWWESLQFEVQRKKLPDL